MSAASPVVMEARDVRRHYAVNRGMFAKPGTVKAVDGVSFSLQGGRTLAVVGESGCGKSTLARMATLLEAPTEGELWIDGKPTANAPAAERAQSRLNVQMVFQNPYGSLNPRKTVGSILEEPLAINNRGGKAEREAAARDVMAKVGLRPEQYGRYPHMFSGGQRQRIAIARALMLNPRVVVADEPVSALDVSIQAQVLNLLMDLQDDLGLAYLFISHDLSVVRLIAHEVMVMYLGRPVEQALDRQGAPACGDRGEGRVALAAEPAAGLRLRHPLPLRPAALHGGAAGVPAGGGASGGVPFCGNDLIAERGGSACRAHPSPGPSHKGRGEGRTPSPLVGEGRGEGWHRHYVSRFVSSLYHVAQTLTHGLDCRVKPGNDQLYVGALNYRHGRA
jgi:dipeptide transport system ATP-binding protein